jgi:hypothetical protein
MPLTFIALVKGLAAVVSVDPRSPSNARAIALTLVDGCSSLSPRGICHDVLGLNCLDGLSKCAADGDTVWCAAADRPAHRILPTGSGYQRPCNLGQH